MPHPATVTPAQPAANRGNAQLALGRFDDALANYDRALGLQPNNVDVQFNRGNALHALNRFSEALASHERALAVRPSYAEAYSNRGLVLEELRRFDEALESYDHAIALRTDYAEAHSNRGVALEKLMRSTKRWRASITPWRCGRTLPKRTPTAVLLSNVCAGSPAL